MVMQTSMINQLNRVSLLAVALFAIAACDRSSRSANTDSTAAQAAQAAQSADTLTMLRGTVVSISGSELVLKTDTNSATVRVGQPFHVYARVPSDLTQVKEKSFIGVTTEKQPDGTELATEIHVFPEELRGVGEGSRMMAPNTGGGGNRMTNGNVAPSRMTNGTATPSRMSNGSVSSTTGSAMVVQYAGGSQNVTVPSNTPVTEFKIASRPLAAGDQAVIVATKAPDGSFLSTKAILMSKE
jgi:hypothetical protein